MAKNNRKVATDTIVANPQPTQPDQSKEEKNKMSRGPRKDSTSKVVYVKFSEPEDIALYERLCADAKAKRYPVEVYITLVLLEAYPAPVPEAQTDLELTGAAEIK